VSISSGLGSLHCPTLSELITADTRKLIAAARSDAIRGRLDDALRALSAITDSSPANQTALHLTRAELFHLDQRTEEALAVFDQELSPLEPYLPEEMCLTIERNRMLASFGGGFPDWHEMDRHAGLIDRRRLLRIETRDAEALIAAAEAARSGKSYESLPVYTEAIFEAYRRFDWQGARQAGVFLAQEHLRLNNPDSACFYTVISEDPSTAKAVASQLRAANDPIALDRCLAKLEEVCHLRRHLMLASRLLAELGDAIPDDRIEIWLSRLSPHWTRLAVSTPDRWMSEAALKATTALLGGATGAQADGIIAEILVHPNWSMNPVSRLQLLDPLEAAAERATKAACRRVIEAVSPLICGDKPGADYRKCLEVLLAIAQRVPALKPLIRSRIYRQKEGVTSLLARLAPAFGVKGGLERPDEKAVLVVDRLRLQVEQLNPGQKPSTGLGELMIQTSDGPSGSVVVKVLSSSDDLLLLSEHRRTLSEESVVEVVNAVIDLIRNPANVNANRAILFDILHLFGDVMNSQSASNAIDTMAQFAGDYRAFGHPLYGQEEAYSPLNPFRMNAGFPQDVRGKALFALAAMAKNHAPAVGARLTQLLDLATADSQPVIRRHAYSATGLAGNAARECLPSVVAGTRDADPTAATVALQICGVHAETVIGDGLLPVVLGSLETQHRHPDLGIRFGAAVAVAKLNQAAQKLPVGTLGGELSERLSVVAKRLATDVSRRVREAATRINQAPIQRKSARHDELTTAKSGASNGQNAGAAH